MEVLLFNCLGKLADLAEQPFAIQYFLGFA